MCQSSIGSISSVLQPTPFCNINCDYCYLSDRISKRQLSLDLLEHIFVKLFASKLTGPQLSVVWHAGEPLVLPIAYYEAALKKIKSLNTRGCQIHHAIQTNGTLITQRWCDFFKASNIHVGVSVDGPAFIHDANRKTRSGRGTHAKIMEGISLLQENGINFHVIAVISQQSLNFPDEIFKFFIQHGIRRVGFNIEEIEGENTVTSLKYPGTDKRYVRFMSRIYELSKITQGYLSIREFDDVKRLILSGLHIRRSFQSTPCSIISIDCNGNFTTFSQNSLVSAVMSMVILSWAMSGMIHLMRYLRAKCFSSSIKISKPVSQHVKRLVTILTYAEVEHQLTNTVKTGPYIRRKRCTVVIHCKYQST